MRVPDGTFSPPRVLFRRQAAAHHIEVKAQFLTFQGNAARRPAGKIRDGHQWASPKTTVLEAKSPSGGAAGAGSTGTEAGWKKMLSLREMWQLRRIPIRRKVSRKVVLLLVRSLHGFGGYDAEANGRDCPEERSSNQESALRWIGIPELPLLPRNMPPPVSR